MTQTFKKSVSILLAVIMILSVFTIVPMSAGAVSGVAKILSTNQFYPTLSDAFAAAVDGDTILVVTDSAGNGIKVPQGKFNNAGLYVEFNGHTYTVDGSLVGSTGTETQAFQLLKDNNITFADGTIYSENAKMLIQNYSNLTLENMTLTLNNPNYAYAYTLSNNNGNVVIDETTINANPAGGFAFDVCRYASYPSVNVTVTGDSVINGDVEVYASNGDAKDGFSLNLVSGEMTGAVVVDDSAAAAMEAAPAVTSITKDDEDFHIYVAELNNNKYESLEAAFAAAVDGDTINVLADSAGNGIKAPQGKFQPNGLTVDFGGHTYTQDGTLVGSTGTETQAFQLLKDNTITFQNGTITSTKAKMLIQNYSNLTLDNMTLTLNNPNYAYAYTLSNNNGDVVIEDTTINANPAGGFAFDVCRYASYPSVNVTVTGASVINGDVEVYASGNDAKDGFSLTLESGTLNGDIDVTASAAAAIAATPAKAEVTKASTFTQAAPAGYVWVDGATEGEQTIAKAAAQIGTTGYLTLEAAVAAAVDGDTVTLLGNSSGNGIQVLPGRFTTEGLTIDFDGYTYDVDGATVGSPNTKTQAFQLQMNNKITLKDGTITSSKAKMLVQNYSDLTLDNMVLDGSNLVGSGRYTLSNNNGNVLIDDTTIIAKEGANYAFDVCRYSSYPSVNVTVTGNSVIDGDVEVTASGSDAKEGFSLNLVSGTMDGDILVRASAATAMANDPEDTEIKKAATFDQAAPAGYVWVAGETEGEQTIAKAVAQIEGGAQYATLVEAFANVQDGETITLLSDSTGCGIKVVANQFPNGVTVDFDGHTYTVDRTLVGSTGYESQAFHLEQGNTFLFKDGTITSTNARMLVQNYSDLTLKNMTLDGSNLDGTGRYTLSNNNGNVVIDDTTIIAKEGANYAFDVCRFQNYPSVNVTVTGASVIDGDVEITASGSNAKDGFSLNLVSGTMDGDILVRASAEAAMTATPDKVEIEKATTFDQAAPAGYVWVDGETEGEQTIAKAAAQIGTTGYLTLEAAFAAAVDGDTIVVLDDCSGNGIKVPENKFNTTGLTVDFGGHTYTVNGTTVGSTNTETQGFQLLKGNKITFQNGAITGSSVDTPSLIFLIQNYSDLTLDDMELSLTGTYYSQYTLSNNNGEIVINDSIINAPDYTWISPSLTPSAVGSFAFDVCRYASYPSVSVTVTGDSVINGDVEVSATGSDAKDGVTLNLVGGTLNGDIVLDETAKNVIAETPAKASVNKQSTFNQEAPTGYEWVGEGTTQTLAPIVDLALKHSISLNGNIDLNFYLNPAIVQPGDEVSFTWGDTDEIIDDAEGYGTHSYTVRAADLTDDGYKATISVPAAEMTYDITASYGNVTDSYSVRDYCVQMLNNSTDGNLNALLKRMLYYGAKAQIAFDVNTDDLANAGINNGDFDGGVAYVTDAQIAGRIAAANNDETAADLSAIAGYKTTSLFFLTNNVIRHYFKTAEVDANFGDNTVSDGYYGYIDSAAIPAAELDNLQTFTVGNTTFKYSALDYVRELIKSTVPAYKNLAAATYWYNQAANTYFDGLNG